MKQKKRKRSLESVIVENNPLELELLRDLKALKKEAEAEKDASTS